MLKKKLESGPNERMPWQAGSKDKVIRLPLAIAKRPS